MTVMASKWGMSITFFWGAQKNTGAIDLFYIRSSEKIPFPTSMQLILAYFNPDCHESEIQEAIIRLLIASKLYIYINFEMLNVDI